MKSNENKLNHIFMPRFFPVRICSQASAEPKKPTIPRMIQWSLLIYSVYCGNAKGPSPDCQVAWELMKNDTSLQHWSNQLHSLCYVKYQNNVLVNPDAIVKCKSWELDAHCVNYMNGRTCRYLNGFLEIAACVPYECDESELPSLTQSYFPGTGASLDCSIQASTGTPIISAVISTVVVLSISALAVFVLRPPLAVREGLKLKKARSHLLSLSGSDSAST